MIKKIINKFYGETIEDLCVRLLYFFNTIDTYFIIAGLLSSFILLFILPINLFLLVISILAAVFIARFSDFYPLFIILATPVLVATGFLLQIHVQIVLLLALINIAIFFVIQFCFMGIPDSIVARDPSVAFIKMYNSLFTIAPTTVSFVMSFYYALFLSYCIYLSVTVSGFVGYIYLFCAFILLLFAAFITRICRPKNHYSKFLKPDTPQKPIFEKLIILNIDGVRKDIFDKLELPVYTKLKKESSWHAKGLETVYRALTNPAFASIFTGSVPRIHRVKDNNFGQTIKVEGLPDIVPAIAYGSMHVKHFCKKYWETKIVSLPEHSVYKSDDIMLEWLKDDIINRTGIRLFVADFSEADFLAHAYGSRSEAYKDALRRTDVRIGRFIEWLKTTPDYKKTGVIICSDHGIAAIDHSYLLAESEKYVPFLIYGNGIKKNYEITKPGKIMDICCTAAYLLGARYPSDSRGQVFPDVLETIDATQVEEELVSRFNLLKYEAEAESYSDIHQEIYKGDAEWWEKQIDKIKQSKKPVKVLDIGCGAGFVGEKFLKAEVNIDKFVCMDISEQILNKARKKLGKHTQFQFVNELDGLNEKFDVITASSIFHHLLKPQRLAKKVDELLAPGGIVLGSHEPDVNAFKNRIFAYFARIYKMLGGGITISDEVEEKFNQLLKDKYPGSSRVCKEEILQITEYHSPVEQYLYDIDRSVGFDPQNFYRQVFQGYEVQESETYTTCFYRSFFDKHRITRKILIFFFSLVFKRGNLFRFRLKKP